MFPIREQKGHDINFEKFKKRFNGICQDHIKTNRSKSFAFIFYSSKNTDICKILNDRDAVLLLDRLTGEELIIFYIETPMHARAADRRKVTRVRQLVSRGNLKQLKRLANRSPQWKEAALNELITTESGSETAERSDPMGLFNSEFMAQLGLKQNEIDLPCVVFFKLDGKQFTDIRIAYMKRPNLIHGFHELYEIIAQYKAGQYNVDEKKARQGLYGRWFKSAANFVSVEVVSSAIAKGIVSILGM